MAALLTTRRAPPWRLASRGPHSEAPGVRFITPCLGCTPPAGYDGSPPPHPRSYPWNTDPSFQRSDGLYPTFWVGTYNGSPPPPRLLPHPPLVVALRGSRVGIVVPKHHCAKVGEERRRRRGEAEQRGTRSYNVSKWFGKKTEAQNHTTSHGGSEMEQQTRSKHLNAPRHRRTQIQA